MNTIEDFTTPTYTADSFEELRDKYNIIEQHTNIGNDRTVRRNHDRKLLDEWKVINHRGQWGAYLINHQITIRKDSGADCNHAQTLPHKIESSRAYAFTAQCACGTLYTLQMANPGRYGQITEPAN